MSSDDIVIDVRRLAKRYEIYSAPRDRLKQFVLPRLHGAIGRVGRLAGLQRGGSPAQYFREFWALSDVTFQVRRGETLGVIGRNGSGKSTLLQILAGTLTPTRGDVTVNGRVAALLELGSGFNPEFTGRENVLLNARILGLSDQEIAAAFDAIVEFADIGEFIDQPVKTYSSGMFVRLAFAVQAHSNPRLLVIDEALSVGDIFFQQKCFAHIRGLQDKGVTIVFVSHDTSAVQNVCDRAIWLVEGGIEFDGPPEEAVSRYFAGKSRSDRNVSDAGRPDGAARASQDAGDDLRSIVMRHNVLQDAKSRHGQGRLRLVAAAVRNQLGDYSLNVQMLSCIRITILVQATEDVEEPMAGIHVFDRFNSLVFASGTRQLKVPVPRLAAGEEVLVEFSLEMRVQAGEYTFSLGCAEPSAEDYNVGIVHDRWEGLGPLKVFSVESGTLPFYGMVQLPFKVEQVRLLERRR